MYTYTYYITPVIIFHVFYSMSTFPFLQYYMHMFNVVLALCVLCIQSTIVRTSELLANHILLLCT